MGQPPTPRKNCLYKQLHWAGWVGVLVCISRVLWWSDFSNNLTIAKRHMWNILYREKIGTQKQETKPDPSSLTHRTCWKLLEYFTSESKETLRNYGGRGKGHWNMHTQACPLNAWIKKMPIGLNYSKLLSFHTNVQQSFSYRKYSFGLPGHPQMQLDFEKLQPPPFPSSKVGKPPSAQLIFAL